MDTRIVTITGITSLKDAKINYNASAPYLFRIDWSSTSAPDIGYRVYRYIGDYPNNENYDPKSNTSENFVFLTQLSTSTGYYEDTLADITGHGFNIGERSNVLDQIFTTKRKLYYKIVQVNNRELNFNTLPFLVVGHDDGSVTCRSTISQVKFNTFYSEGGLIWNKNAADIGLTGYSVRSVAVDPNFEDRVPTVWIAGTNSINSKVIRIDIETGGTKINYTYNFTYPIYGARVDPYTGDCIVSGRSGSLARCHYDVSGSITYFGTIPNDISIGNTGGYALCLANNNNQYRAYTDWNQQWITYLNMNAPGVSNVIPTNNYGGYISNRSNSFGICNGADGNVFTNGHTITRVQWTDVRLVSDGYWSTYSGCCYDGGSHHTGCAAGYYSCDKTEWVDTSYYVTDTGDSGPFFADNGYVYKVTTETDTVSALFTVIGGPGHNGYPGASNGRTAPDPNIVSGTYDGIKCDIPTGSITGSNYNVWQSDNIEDCIHKIVWNGTSLSHNPAHNYSITDVNEVAVDSENNVWGIPYSYSTSYLKYYNTLINNNTFPNGGTCRWPASGTSLWNYGGYYNDPYVEYVLTRNVADALYTEIYNETNQAIKRQKARQWAALSGGNVQGRLVYPAFDGTYTPVYFARTGENSSNCLIPNSDETGLNAFFTLGRYYSVPSVDHPQWEDPTIEFYVDPKVSTPALNDTRFWNDQKGGTRTVSVSGYDNLSVFYQISVTNPTEHTFELQNHDFLFDDRNKDICGDTKCICTDIYPDCGANYTYASEYIGNRVGQNSINYMYHDPSKSGKPGNRWDGWTGEISGTYTVNGTAYFNENCYLISGTSPYAGYDYPIFTNNIDVTVLERWPTARFYINPFNLDEIRNNWFNTSMWKRDDITTSNDNGLPVTDPNMIVSGIVPLSCQITDISISRTWPLTSWFIDFKSDETPYASIFHLISDYNYDYTYPPVDADRTTNHITYTTSAATVGAKNSNYHTRDSNNITHTNFAKHVYFNPGTYDLTLYVAASNTLTESADISVGVTDQSILSGFTKYATRRLIVKDACPWANYTTVSAITVPSAYHDEYGSVIADPICAAYIDPIDYGRFISGYAPNLTITWRDSSVARTYPLCAYEWNFGDYYNEVSNVCSIYVDSLVSGFPYWISDKTGHYVTHTYIMPGIYNVALNLSVSGTDTRACQVCSKDLHVYVKEINPQACFSVGFSSTGPFDVLSVSGATPVTLYFNPSCTIPGSFPICRIDWDFGDGTDILTITRRPSTESFIGPIAYPSDVADPRNVIVDHTYTRYFDTDPSTYTVTMSAYACNTHTVDVTNGSFTINNLEIYNTDDNIKRDKPAHLIGMRSFSTDNNTFMVFEGNKYTYNYLLSGINNV